MTTEICTWIGRVWAATFLAIVALIAVEVCVGKLAGRAQRRRDVRRARQLGARLVRTGGRR